MDAIGLVWDWLATHSDIIIIQTVNGIVTGMILALIASGLTLIFGIMDIVNFAHGELFMLGAYVGVVVLAISGSFWLALALHPCRGAVWSCSADHHLATAHRPRSLEHHPRHIRHFARAAEFRAVAVRPRAAQARRADYRAVRSLLPRLPMVPAPDRAAVRRAHRRPLPLPQARHLRHLDTANNARQGDGAGDGHSGAVGPYRRLRHRCRNGGRQRGAVWAIDRHQPRHGARLGSQGLYRRRRRRHG